MNLTWSACHDAGMTAMEAAEAMCMRRSSTYQWGRRAGNRGVKHA